MLGHLSFGVADLPRAIAFYDAVLAPLGYVRVWTIEQQAGYGPPGGGDKLALKLQSGPVVPPGPGFHLAFVAPSRAAVDRFHGEACAPAGAMKARRVRAHITARRIMRPSCAIPMGTSSRRSFSN
jgi:catechol 2,3-dioxygenase-like lactoylglutathione lyase family enzyme